MSLFGKEYRLVTPLSEQDVRKVKAGDILFIAGEIWSGRSAVLKQIVEEHKPLPIDTSKLNVFFTGGEGLIPANKEKSLWEALPLAATLGLRFEKWIPKLIERAGLKAVITKGNMRQGTRQACLDFGCLQLVPFGWTVTPYFTEVLRNKVKNEEVFWSKKGLTEALIVYHVGHTGPWLVNIDTRGNALYDEIYKDVNSRLQEIYKKINLPPDFEYTSLEQ